MNHTCENCQYFAKVYTGLDPSPGECRRSPPVVNSDGWTRWPRVMPQYWCGEQRPKVSG